ncbi:hypothetical protein Q1695_013791 [Nippostrongylus brasiliensis]|nr:hypothetical protein Q1695_013791 [Nippostrongylus brasiliensis]
MMDFADVDDDNEFEVFYGHDDDVQDNQSRATCSLDDILNDVEMSEQREDTDPEYGANYVFCSGEKVMVSAQDTELRSTLFHRRYIRKCMDHFKKTWWRVLADSDIDDLCGTIRSETASYGSRFKFEPNTWPVAWEPDRLEELTTSTIQAMVCAALNSKRRLQLVIGLGSGRKVVGCAISRKQRDRMRQAFDYCICTGIFPRLPQKLARIRLIKVEGCSSVDGEEERFLIEICVVDRVGNLYQVAPNHIYYVEGDDVKETQDIDKARLILLSDLKTKMSAPPSIFGASCDQCNVPISSWIFPTVSRLLKEFLVFSLSGALLGLFARTQTGRVWARLSALRSFHLPR